jgi:Cu(I)/Ag(I) efflux system membrane protein CusA/SilA
VRGRGISRRAGTGMEVMQRIAAPRVGGMTTAPLLSMFVVPAAYLLLRRPRRPATGHAGFWMRLVAS